MYLEEMGYEHACRNAKIVLRACKDMGFVAVWTPSRRSESEYVEVWKDAPHSRQFKVRFADHPVSDWYWNEWLNESQFEVAHSRGHAQVAGNSYHAVAWLGKQFNRSLPSWILHKTGSTPDIP